MEMTGETLREVAVLVAVFFLLDNSLNKNRFPLSVCLIVLSSCVATLALGMVLEKYRE
jgi:hypothetical protein